MAPYEKIDTHSHFVPPGYRTASLENGHEFPDGMPGIPPWTEEAHLHMMETTNITKSIISITSPGTHLVPNNNALARKLTRYCNEFASELKHRSPSKFGFWASLPMPDVPGSLDEITYALDTLHADGFTMETNHHGTYLGDKSLDPIFAELNRRKAIIFIHPTTPCLPNGGEKAIPLPQFPRPMFEFLFDTARAVMNLFLSGTVAACPNITFIVPHVGGALPPLINRFATIPTVLSLPGVDTHVNPTWVKERLNSQFYFDTAGWAFPEQIQGLLPYVTVERMLYGSDFPYTPLKAVQVLSADHDKYLKDVFPERADQEALCTGNARKLLERSGSKI
jgi:predicted TIM-barrel fold metal-dependent hydrolase